MLQLNATVAIALLVVSTGIATVLAAVAARNRSEPGATPFAALMVSTGIWTGTYAVSLLTHDRGLRVFMEGVQWIGIGGVPVWLLLFALAYTGHDEILTERTVAALCLLPALTVALALTNPIHELIWVEHAIAVVDGIALMDRSWGPVFWLYILYTYVLVAVAAVLLLRLILLSDFLYADQSVLLVVGITAPSLANLVDLFGPLTGPSIEFAPYAFTVTGVAFGYALFRRRLFDLVPATRRLGRNAAISQLDDGVLIVDNDHRIVYCNEAAGDILDCTPGAALGESVRALVDEERVDFEAEDALAEITRDDRTYEVRTSPITDRSDRDIGHTLVFHDVTARKRRERALAAQRDELARLEELNAVLRGVNQALVSATSREEIERAVCERLAEADRFRTACIGDLPTWTGEADRWLVAGGDRGGEPAAVREEVGPGTLEEGDGPGLRTVRPTDAAAAGTWAVVPIAYGETVFGAVGLEIDREGLAERERAVLAELGETVGHAINALETRQLLAAEAVVELELESTDTATPLVAASSAGAALELSGIVPGSDGSSVAYVRLEGENVPSARERLADAAAGPVRTIREGDDEALVEWSVTGRSVLGRLVDHGAHVTGAHAAEGRARYECELASGADVRALSDHLEAATADAHVVSKRERARPAERPPDPAGSGLGDLTERQREAIEAAYRAGYFEWPRESDAEAVADAMGITSPTLHNHLRKAERTLLDRIFEESGVG